MKTFDQKIILNSEKHRFELVVDGKLSMVVFQNVDEHTLALVHTEVHPDLEGQGVGSAMVEQVLDYIEAHKFLIVPLCPFVAAYIKRHSDWQRVVSKEYNESDF